LVSKVNLAVLLKEWTVTSHTAIFFHTVNTIKPTGCFNYCAQIHLT